MLDETIGERKEGALFLSVKWGRGNEWGESGRLRTDGHDWQWHVTAAEWREKRTETEAEEERWNANVRPYNPVMRHWVLLQKLFSCSHVRKGRGLEKHCTSRQLYFIVGLLEGDREKKQKGRWRKTGRRMKSRGRPTFVKFKVSIDSQQKRL